GQSRCRNPAGRGCAGDQHRRRLRRTALPCERRNGATGGSRDQLALPALGPDRPRLAGVSAPSAGRAAVLVVAAHPAHKRTIGPSGGLLPILLASVGCEIEPVVGTQKQVTAAGVGRIGVEGAIAFTKEGANTWQPARPSHPVRVFLLDLRGILVVVLNGRNGRVQGDVEVIIEVTAVRGIPRDGP